MKPFGSLAVAGALLGLGPACSVTALADREGTRAVNECTVDDDCGGGSCSAEGMCVASEGQLAALLFELTPTAQADRAGGKPNYWIFEIPAAGGSRPLLFPGVANVTTTIIAPTKCQNLKYEAKSGKEVSVALDGSIPARVTFVPVERGLGLDVERYSFDVDTTQQENFPVSTDSFATTLQVPIGSYDVYIEPRPAILAMATVEQRALCAMPPQLVREQPLSQLENMSLEIKLASAATLDLEVRSPEGQSLAGWQIEMLDPATGSVLSNRLVIPQDAKRNYPAELAYSPVAIYGTTRPDRSGQELIHLSPPSGAIGPSVLFQRRALELLDAGSASIEPLLRLPTPVTVESQVLTRDGMEPVSASVTITATRILAAPPGVFATFSARAKTDREGRFIVSLIPGSYRVEVVPEVSGTRSGRELTISTADWEIPVEPINQAGRVVEVDRVVDISGQAILPWSDTGALGALVGVDPSVLVASPDVLGRSLGASLPPRASHAAIDDPSGDFAFPADSGTVDFFVRPPDGSGLAWFVMPGLKIEDRFLSLGRLALPLPIRLEGAAHLSFPATTSSAALAQSHITAYALLGEDHQPVATLVEARRAIAVAETRLDRDGRYQLSVPALLHGPADR